MRHALTPLLLLALAACASPTEAPYAVNVTDQKAFTADKAQCAEFAKAYHAPLSWASIGEAFVKGAASNSASGAISILVPVIGGAGQATTTALDELDVLTGSQRQVFLKCMDLTTQRDRSALVLEPNP